MLFENKVVYSQSKVPHHSNISCELCVDGNLIDGLGYPPPISLLVPRIGAAVFAEPQEVYIVIEILFAFRSLGFLRSPSPSCMDHQLLAHYTTPAESAEGTDSSWCLVTSDTPRHECFLKTNNHLLEELPLSDTVTTLPTPEAIDIQLTGVECYNPPRFIFYPISWDESDGLLMSTEADDCSGTNLRMNVDCHIPELHDDEPDPLSAVIYREDPYESVDRWRRDVVDSQIPLWDDPLEHREDLENMWLLVPLSLPDEPDEVAISLRP